MNQIVNVRSAADVRGVLIRFVDTGHWYRLSLVAGQARAGWLPEAGDCFVSVRLTPDAVELVEAVNRAFDRYLAPPAGEDRQAEATFRAGVRRLLEGALERQGGTS